MTDDYASPYDDGAASDPQLYEAGDGNESRIFDAEDGGAVIVADTNRAVPGYDSVATRFADGTSVIVEELGDGSAFIGVDDDGIGGMDRLYLVEGDTAWPVDPTTGYRLDPVHVSEAAWPEGYTPDELTLRQPAPAPAPTSVEIPMDSAISPEFRDPEPREVTIDIGSLPPVPGTAGSEEMTISRLIELRDAATDPATKQAYNDHIEAWLDMQRRIHDAGRAPSL